VHDRQFGAGFIKICSYFPYPAKVWVNGHEWAKRQAAQAGIGFAGLANGFASREDPAGLQAICDRFGPADVQAFFDRWTRVIPAPFTPADRAAGYWWELSMRQVEVSRTLVFDDPRRARGWHARRMRVAAASGWSPNSWAIRATQARTPSRRITRLIAWAAAPAVGASDGCSPEANSARHRAWLTFSLVTASCVMVGISHHPVSYFLAFTIRHLGAGHFRVRP
jgi:hypothetical protein